MPNKKSIKLTTLQLKIVKTILEGYKPGGFENYETDPKINELVIQDLITSLGKEE